VNCALLCKPLIVLELVAREYSEIILSPRLFLKSSSIKNNFVKSIKKYFMLNQLLFYEDNKIGISSCQFVKKKQNIVFLAADMGNCKKLLDINYLNQKRKTNKTLNFK